MSKKTIAFAGAMVTFSGLAIRAYLNFETGLQNGINPFIEVLKMLGYMTIWTNILVLLGFMADAFSWKNQLFQFLRLHSTKTAIALFILIVGIVYHFLLSATYNPEGLAKVANGIMHYVTPVGFFLYWAIMERKFRLPYLLSFSWLIYPIAYAGVSIFKGMITHTYPYPFLDVNALGYGQITLNMMGLGGFYLIAGWILIAINNQLAEKERSA
jgi:hypothetical protein